MFTIPGPTASCLTTADDVRPGMLDGRWLGEAGSSRRVMRMHSAALIEGRAVIFHADSHV